MNEDLELDARIRAAYGNQMVEYEMPPQVWENVSDPYLRFDKIKIPRLLADRMGIWKIPAHVLRLAAAYERVLVYLIPDYEGEFIPGTSLVRPDRAKARAMQDSPRGVIVSAGIKAREQLRSHLIDVGHVVSLMRLAIWRVPCGYDEDAVERFTQCCQSTDIACSEDRAALEARGLVSMRLDEKTGKFIAVNHITGHEYFPENMDLPQDYG